MSELVTEIDLDIPTRLSGDIEFAKAYVEMVDEDREKSATRIAELEAENKKLKEALKPRPISEATINETLKPGFWRSCPWDIPAPPEQQEPK